MKNLLKKLKIKNRILYCISQILKPFLKLEYKILRNKSKQSLTTKRLFSTTGNISLLKVLTLIKQTGNEDRYEDYLIIHSNGSSDFWENNLKIAKMHNFKKIYTFVHIRYSSAFILNNLYFFDEIYTINHPDHLGIIDEIYNRTKINLVDEGCASLLNYNLDKIPNLSKFYTNVYLNKLDSFNFTNELKNKIVQLDNKILEDLTQKISIKYPIIPTINFNDKYILYCGIYWEVSGLSKDKFAKEQSELINNLLNTGYKILYKPHPRDTEFYGYENNPNVLFVTTVLPVEVYQWDVLAVVSMSSTTVINLAHYSKIAGFSNVLEETLRPNRKDKVMIPLIRKIISEYSPNYKELLKFDVKNLTKVELKAQITSYYDKFITKKTMLSNNPDIQNYYRSYNEAE